MNVVSTNEPASAFLEMQIRALIFAKVLRVQLSKGSSSMVARLKKELSTFGVLLKAALDTNSVQAKDLQKMKYECDTLRAKFEALEKESNKLSGNLKSAEENLSRPRLPMTRSYLRRS